MIEHRSFGNARRSSYRYVMAAVVLILTFSFGLSWFAVAPVTPLIMGEFNINRSTASLLISLIALTHLILGVPSSILVSRIGPRKAITAGAVLGSFPVLSFLTMDYSLLLLTRIVLGAGIALIFTAMGPLAMQWFSARELPLFNGLWAASMALGMAVSSFLVVPLSDILGWKLGLSIFGGISVIGGMCWVVFSPNLRTSGKELQKFPIKDTVQVMKSRNTLLIAAADAGPYALLAATAAWLPSFYHEVHGMSLVKAGSLMGILALSGTCSLIATSFLMLWIAHRRIMLIIPGIIVGFAGLGSFLLAGTPLVYLAVAALGATAFMYLPTLLTIPMELPGTDPLKVAVIFGTLMSVGSAATMLSPFIVGFTTDLLDSYVPSLTLFSVLAWSLPIAGFLLPETGPTAKTES
ncbi:uncharacterized protein METZ01_LOCUS189189 [marine metagenome]|uniref:Major facilitator superfamily (MFS) profile domain-containing protein n=1 Tax=marine metagenome TaxID=408172 RepID=A0A382DDK8_9ZZZZ